MLKAQIQDRAKSSIGEDGVTEMELTQSSMSGFVVACPVEMDDQDISTIEVL
jgi:hypothetical protein